MHCKWMLLLIVAAIAADLRAAERVDYEAQVKPLLATKCFACHGALKQESGLRLDAASLIRKGGDSGPAIVAGRADDSLLVYRVAAEAGERMPPEGEGEPLSAEQIATLSRWIDQGAVAPDEPIPPAPGEHWAFQQPMRPDVPVGEDASSFHNPVDALLRATQHAAGVSPAPPAAKHVLLRRLYLDLIGLPPTREELHDFLQDDSPRAYERVVERLLASPQYGERWGRHWMDVWRYSDWAGFGSEIRYSQRHIWRWRDWIVASLNADLGYDRMIEAMLAADELAPRDCETLRATGFLARNWYKFDRNIWLDDVVEHTGKAFLGMTFKCARCHDHKYDPVSQQEYYRLRAVFEPYDVRTDRVPGQLDVGQDGLARIYDARPEAPTYVFLRGDPKQADEEHPVGPGVPEVLGGELSIEPVALPPESFYPALRPFVASEMIDQARAKLREAEAAASEQAAMSEEEGPLREKRLIAAKARLEAIEKRVAAERARYGEGREGVAADADRLAGEAARGEALAAVADADEKLLVATRTLAKAQASAESSGDDAKAKQAVEAAQKQVDAARMALQAAREKAKQASSAYEPLGPNYPRTSSGRRLALARWITSRRNPLTARVAVNHIWLRHFGRPLVDSVDDFGLRTPRPQLADLLDYLAVEFMEQGWSMKHVHRLIVRSAAYRSTSVAGPESAGSLEKDPDNTLFWRMNRRRMEAEAVRDALLHAAGSLDLARGGPDIDHAQGLTVARRSLYFRHARERQMEFLRMFDAANPRECYRRQESIRPQQAFALVNSPLALAQSRKLAARLVRGEAAGEASEDSFIMAAFETVLSRAPGDAELHECRRFLEQQARLLANPSGLELLADTPHPVPPSADPLQRARENLVLVLLNHNDFVTIR